MARRSESLEEVIAASLKPVVGRIAARLAEYVGAAVASQLEAKLGKLAPKAPRGHKRGRRAGRPVAKAELTRWVADRRARRVPTFVIELTGLDTKKKIVARYGADSAFEKGKPLPSAAAKGAAEPPKARPPIIRKRAAAA